MVNCSAYGASSWDACPENDRFYATPAGIPAAASVRTALVGRYEESAAISKRFGSQDARYVRAQEVIYLRGAAVMAVAAEVRGDPKEIGRLPRFQVLWKRSERLDAAATAWHTGY